MKETVVISRGPGSEKFELRTEDFAGTEVKALKVGSRKLSKSVADLRASNRNREAGIVEEGTQVISTSEEFVSVLDQINSGEAVDVKIKLSQDIDLTGVAYTPINSEDSNASFVLDGDGHSISGLTVESPIIVNEQGSIYGAGFIAQYKGNLTLKNLTFIGCNVALTKDKSFSGNIIGVVVGYAFGDTVFENITVTGCTVEGYGKVGGILGMGAKPGMKVTFKNCTVVGNTLKGCYNIGSLAGLIQRGNTSDFSNVTIEGCTVGSNEVILYPGTEEKPVEYKELNTVVDEIDCETVPQNYPITGKYALLNGYWYGAVAPNYVSYGVSTHDCRLVGEEYPLADSEIIF